MKKIVIITSLLLMVASAVYAETRYVTDYLRINLRTGKGNNYRIIRMVPSGQRVEVLEEEDKWARIELPDGAEGWVQAQYLQEQPAARQTVETLQDRLEPLETEYESLKEENQRLLKMNQEMAEQIEEMEKELEDARNAYETLREDSAEFLKIKEEHEQLTAAIEEKNARIEELEGRITEEFLSTAIKWFLAGAGVLLLGMILGHRARKKKRPGLR